MYEKFRELNGSHPWRDVATDAYVDYEARVRPDGRVLYFNFPLAVEMELIGKDHPPVMNEELEQIILDTFSLQIINEHDRLTGAEFPPETIKPRPYMATRYLQLQHKSKQGKTSGDGRSIWNGFVKTRRLTFDLMTRGTGTTILSPGAQESDEPLPTGGYEYGYASGQAEPREMLGTAVMSEILYRQGIPTERTLAVIDYPDGTAVGVRSAPNLIRPAHIFRFLKQGRHAEVKASVDYFINRQIANKVWTLPAEREPRYAAAFRLIASSYGKLAAILEEEYIFNWLAWDGDNMLASGALLDYGSIRQFAAKHNKYRYDDVDRFSSSLTEQRYWARQLVQTFAQAFDFIITGEKKPHDTFRDAEPLRIYDDSFADERDRRLLWRIGFAPERIEHLMTHAREQIKEFRRALAYFEDAKISKGIEKLPDGITHKPVFLIRRLLRQLPAYYLEHRSTEAGDDADALMPPRLFCRIMTASYVSRRDMKLTASRAARAESLQKSYRRLVSAAGGTFDATLTSVAARSEIINHEHRVTGDGLIWIIDEAVNMKERIRRDELQEALAAFIESQVLIPGVHNPLSPDDAKGNRLKARLLRKIEENLEIYKETV